MPDITNTSLKPECCQHKYNEASSPVQIFTYSRIEDICRIAIGIFSAMTAPLLFTVALSLGAATTLATHVWCLLTNRPPPKMGSSKPVCAQGYSEMLSGRKYSPRVNLLLTASFIGAHIQHQSKFFVPFTGVFLGVWASSRVVNAVGTWWHREALPLSSPVSSTSGLEATCAGGCHR